MRENEVFDDKGTGQNLDHAFPGLPAYSIRSLESYVVVG